MASTVYYGTSSTNSGDAVKQVVVNGLSSSYTKESDFLNPGDVLMVYFSQPNTSATPYLKLYKGSVSNETGISTDDGNRIQIQSGLNDLSGAWAAGQGCAFIYAELGGVYYWQLIDDGIATDSVYGRVKIINSLIGNINNDAVASAGAIKTLFGTKTPAHLAYQPNGEVGTETVGTLSLLGENDTPLGQPVVIKVPAYLNPDTFRTNTQELINRGPKKESDTPSQYDIGYGLPYITRLIPGRLVFRDSFETNTFKGLTLQTGNTEFQAYQIADANGNSKLRSQKNLTLKSGTGYSVVLDGPTTTTGVATFNTTVKIPIDASLQTQLTNLGWWNDVK